MPKKLGQHFLTNQSIARSIVRNLNASPRDIIIEIGPGHGELTQKLARLQESITVIAIERDDRLVDVLNAKFADSPNITIMHGDALKMLPQVVASHTHNTKPYKIVGNIPYYITGRLLRILGEIEWKPERTVLMTQKEVALRMTATQPKMNILAATVQIWSDPSILGIVSKENFRPPPKVESAVVLLQKKQALMPHKDLLAYYVFAKALFKQPRKTLANNLFAFIPSREDVARVLKRAGIPEGVRPQNLSLEEISLLQKHSLSL